MIISQKKSTIEFIQTVRIYGFSLSFSTGDAARIFKKIIFTNLLFSWHLPLACWTNPFLPLFWGNLMLSREGQTKAIAWNLSLTSRILLLLKATAVILKSNSNSKKSLQKLFCKPLSFFSATCVNYSLWWIYFKTEWRQEILWRC